MVIQLALLPKLWENYWRYLSPDQFSAEKTGKLFALLCRDVNDCCQELAAERHTRQENCHFSILVPLNHFV
jgi:hypothetical protein